MDSPLPPNPYQALGLPKDVDSATIKSTYRKLALKCHPDKVTDESLKKQKQEEFHKIQQAYELIGDDERRARYDAEVKLETLRKEKAAKGGSGAPEVQTARYDVRTQAPAGASFTANGPARYEEHKPSRSYESRSKYDTYEAYPSKQSSRSSREKVSPTKSTKESSDRTRSDYKKSRDKERDRDRRHVVSERERDSEPSGDEKTRYEAEYKRRSEEARRRDEDEARTRRKADERRSYESERKEYERKEYDRKQKLSDQANDAVRYIHRSKVEADRPSAARTNSSRDVRPDYYDSRDSRTRRDRPEVVRRSSARPRGDRHSPPGRDRKGIEIVDWEDDRKAPSFKHSSSSPAEIHVPRAVPHRSYTESSREHRRPETSPTPGFRRSETMPSVPLAPSTRRKEPIATRASGLRESVTPHGSEASSPEAYPTIPPPASSTKRYYYTPGGGVSLAADDVGVANGHRTVLREPERQRHRSPSPLSRPPMGPNRHTEPATKYTTAAPKVSGPPPPLGRSATLNANDIRSSGERGRPLYGEVNSDHVRRENAKRQTSFSPEEVSYSHKIGPDDIRWSAGARSGRDDREYAKPSFGRSATSVY